MMALTDASRHEWLEGRGPTLTLIGFQDDATGKLFSARLLPPKGNQRVQWHAAGTGEGRLACNRLP
jgi:hypothetical protein